eukprot:CAMPEP_0202839452 /NCGR_PEP_ID=MMETSP1389-20130828/52630_1 /ASSEMBLY_ACC=CAM_ASM_000865 /TAXON_ID=302021 /ORGANISM="Rhodomonas sp., Strain CCMP768" /LENGTH=30 /DNA_ID= /DNA_START= /DNA_END= /DNA_ORIENTATION=
MKGCSLGRGATQQASSWSQSRDEGREGPGG